MAKEFLEANATWVLLAPVENVSLTRFSGLSYRIHRVELVAANSLPHRWKQIGLPAKLSCLKQGSYLDHFFDEVETFATIRMRGVGVDVERKLLRLVREELAILALSQLGFAKRHSISVPSLSEEYRTGSRSHFLVRSDQVSWSQPNKTLGHPSPLVLDRQWMTFQRKLFFDRLLDALRGKVRLGRAWCKDLRNAAILVGQSLCSRDLPQAFLWNMIALELLLTKSGDTVEKALPSRAEAFLGWMGYWNEAGYEDRIKDIYSKRCLLVHQGRRDEITLRDVYFTDDLLLNLFANIVGHLTIFHSKDAVIEFSRKVEAERLLGLSGKVRPKTLTFMRRAYRERDFEMG